MATTTASESRSAPLVNRTPRETHDEIRARIRLRQIEGAKRYADADRSDPFAFSRAMTHIRAGITRPNNDGQAAEYDAEPFSEQRRTPTGESYTATVYRNVVRP